MLHKDKPHNYGFVMLMELPMECKATLQDQKFFLQRGQTSYDPERSLHFLGEQAMWHTASLRDLRQSSCLNNILPEARACSSTTGFQEHHVPHSWAYRAGIPSTAAKGRKSRGVLTFCQ